MKFGAHMSISGGLHHALAHGTRAGCDTVQLFTKNQQQWRARPLTSVEIDAFERAKLEHTMAPLLVHDSYLINLASPKDDLWQKSIEAFGEELERCRMLGIPYLVTHPGAHTGSGEEAGLQRVAEAFNRLFDEQVGGDTTVLIETTAGQGSTLGYRFEHLAELIERVEHSDRLAVCVDTCHMLAAGYDFRTPETYAATFEAFDRIVGLDRIKAFHLNDSVKDVGSRTDRHAHIGDGFVGLEGFRLVVNDARFIGLPMILETAKGDDLAEDIENLAKLRNLRTAVDKE